MNSVNGLVNFLLNFLSRWVSKVFLGNSNNLQTIAHLRNSGGMKAVFQADRTLVE